MWWTTNNQGTYQGTYEWETKSVKEKNKSVDFFEEEKNLFIVDDDNEVRERK